MDLNARIKYYAQMQSGVRFLLKFIKMVLGGLVLSLFLGQIARAADVISFKDNRGTVFRLVPFAVVGKEKVVAGLFELFQDQRIYEYFNSGAPKIRPDCEMEYLMGAGPATGFLPVKSMAILDYQDQFVGYVGAHAYFNIETSTEEDILFIDVYCAIKPELHRRGIIKHALLEYCAYAWEKMPSSGPQLKGTTFGVKTRVHPRNVAALGLARSFDPSAVDSRVFVPDYCWDFPEKYRKRVLVSIPMEKILQKVRAYQAQKG